ncbi:lipoyl(octanoyl) transferase [Candidatus Azambacteria bacterium RIFCSPHIGHO2_01_FULL_44_55]|uniref:Octanoyltransferase n=1 Tax=Candidatus Azambacteria bacterium RIFCSPLOWO2_02_FULL_44_14 TaxID=1797306 RepID=A0A1F5CB56_9BACT|nr:MAG: lipoyl(octanoyl) transferase [Candidatus Azambacteria bacterium RIFCSPLOWO2_01_FULL_44_84]OGD33050.1 MAG: lipoyl(octanoyl) transferase [Candidatus Azambacteria bacterium RIFCSPHIGHO2_02_FULL_45_18]OGD40142.1 MAG: lipoyl(octanoyl) transferase [Candidatus Azambacteria bacterium RIFCSPLOWO2_02_FULL_44_14]OGD40879.1 MAG: lipoyl(octanoyl) transferase [Candidatus Azambacteria bacterium RIFCSPHIGHO2_01_FULL_44_55]OGD50512.1 MAG: lipoyl(octanoyl) transferase [Candidatus Azambacteria bacterium R
MIEKDLGLINFEEFLKIQDEFWRKRTQDIIPDALIFAEHPVVYSLGARNLKDQMCHFRTWPEGLAELGIKVIETRRGGIVTCHAPGILGIYIIIKVSESSAGIKLVSWLEKLVIEVLEDYGITAGLKANINRGVWVQDRKIASVGIQISQLVSRFGINLNVSPDLRLFEHIDPCGLVNCQVTSMEKERQLTPPMIGVKKSVWYYANSSKKFKSHT